jgi:hypothetical protein
MMNHPYLDCLSFTPIYGYFGAAYFFHAIIEGSLEVKLPTIWTGEKQRWEEPERRE